MIANALRAQGCSFKGDVVFRIMVAVSFIMALSLAASIPTGIREAPLETRDSFVESFGVIIAIYGAILAAIYASFRYTIDRRNGVVSQRLALQPRRMLNVAMRVPYSGLGGAIVALSACLGGYIALSISMGYSQPPWSSIGPTLALGAAAGLWGLGLGLLVQAHLPALFVVSVSLSCAMFVAMFWGSYAVWFPLLVMLQACGFKISQLGIESSGNIHILAAVLGAIAWVSVALIAGTVSFLRSDVK